MKSPSHLLISVVSVSLMMVVSQYCAPRSISWYDQNMLIWAGMIILAIQWVAFIPAYLKKTERFYDLTGSLTYLTLVWLGLSWANQEDLLTTRRIVVVGMVSLWAIRLGGYLFLRIQRRGGDPRLDEIKRHAASFFMTWTLQALWVYLTLLPVMIILTRNTRVGPLHWSELLGWFIWGIGWLIEIIADRQKSRFQQDPDSRDQWINQGLWRYVQHPNYAGEMILWLGIFISGVAHYSGGEWWAVVSPVFVFCLLRYVSGIPLLRERARARWGDDPAYAAYANATPLLIPALKKQSSNSSS